MQRELKFFFLHFVEVASFLPTWSTIWVDLASWVTQINPEIRSTEEKEFPPVLGESIWVYGIAF